MARAIRCRRTGLTRTGHWPSLARQWLSGKAPVLLRWRWTLAGVWFTFRISLEEAPRVFPSTLDGSPDPDSGLSLPSGVSPLDVVAHTSFRASDIALSQTFLSRKPAAAGGTPPYNWSIIAGTLPAGLALSATTGIVSGTPTTLGTSIFTIRVADSAGQSASQEFALRVLSGELPGSYRHSSVKCTGRRTQRRIFHDRCHRKQCDLFQCQPDVQISRQQPDGTGGETRTFSLAAGRTQTFADILGPSLGGPLTMGLSRSALTHSGWPSWARPRLRASAGPSVKVSRSQSRRS